MEARMSKTPKKNKPRSLAKQSPTQSPSQCDFDVVLGLIEAARTRAMAAVNTTLIDLYWNVGEYICRKVADDGWGQGTVKQLADYVQERQPNSRGYSASNRWRMKQFVATYRHQPKLATLLRELSWSHNLAIMSRSKRDEEREFYLRMAAKERWSFRALQRQLDGALFERVALATPKLATPLRETHPDAATIFKDSYLVHRHLSPNIKHDYPTRSSFKPSSTNSTNKLRYKQKPRFCSNLRQDCHRVPRLPSQPRRRNPRKNARNERRGHDRT
jgi:predicted nuclease of restriction endonuclease-like (RecB) superfamily